ncbi:MAG: type II toxin-antitoxin system prevent-host-death family antitoxin [Clostridia bacterium]|nr:type II toxin-antitoxin system prevent-host-death family antitoxin [Clostridia bacterium]
MPNIKPVSDLRNYNEVLVECENGNPVFLTKNGRGKYVIIDIKEYEKQQATLKLISKLAEAENAVKSEAEWLEFSELKEALED